MGTRYYFVSHDAKTTKLAETAVCLDDIKSYFDDSPSRRAFLWLDFCHSGGILPRSTSSDRRELDLIDALLKVVKGEGKLIVAACANAEGARVNSRRSWPFHPRVASGPPG